MRIKLYIETSNQRMFELTLLKNKNYLIKVSLVSSNILLTKDENIKIGDLGIAKTFNTLSTEVVSTLAGTRGYMSPEILDNKVYSYNSDVW